MHLKTSSEGPTSLADAFEPDQTGSSSSIGGESILGPAARPDADDAGAGGSLGPKGGTAPGAAASAAGLRLETSSNNVTRSRLVLASCNCRARTCRRCGKRKGWEARQVLLERSHLWVKPGMFTLTVDRSKFATPEAAHTAITDGRYVPRLLAKLGVARWVWTLEFQTATGDGWPHWHLLIDLSSLPGQRLDLKRAWHWWRDVWQLGGLDLHVKSTKAADAKHAVFYITKYLTKPPRGGFPLWVLDRHGVRFVQASKAVGSLVFKPKRTMGESKKRRDYKPRAALIERMAKCQQETVGIMMGVDPATGEQICRFAGSIKVPLPMIRAMADCARFHGRVVEVEVNGRERVTLEGIGINGLKRVVASDERWRSRANSYEADQLREILEENVFAKRTSDSKSS